MVLFPRCYNIFNEEELTAFIENFRMTACISLIKFIQAVTKEENLIFDEDGTVAHYFTTRQFMSFLFLKKLRYLTSNFLTFGHRFQSPPLSLPSNDAVSMYHDSNMKTSIEKMLKKYGIINGTSFLLITIKLCIMEHCSTVQRKRKLM